MKEPARRTRWPSEPLPVAADGDGGEAVPLRTGDGDAPSVLLAEDTESNRQIIAALLEKLGCTVRTVTNGAEAVDLVSREAFDAVLKNVQMPVMDGETAVRTIRSMGGVSRTPVIGITPPASSSLTRTAFLNGRTSPAATRAGFRSRANRSGVAPSASTGSMDPRAIMPSAPTA